MPVSVVIHLKSTSREPIITGNALGRETQGWFLSEVLRIDPILGEALHTHHDRIRPYTISGLLGSPQSSGYGLRITSLTSSLSDVLLNTLRERLLNRTIYIHSNGLTINRWIDNSFNDEWAGQMSYDELASISSPESPPKNNVPIQFQFVTPTSFRSQGIDLLFPLPFHVFRSILFKWNAFCPSSLQISEDALKLIEEYVVTSGYSLRTEKVWFDGGKRGAATGFIGDVRYSLLSVKHSEPEKLYPANLDQTLRLLASFAMYSGVGHHTTMGLGQARAVLE